MANAKRFIELGMATPLAKETARQITAGVGNRAKLAELTMVPRLATEVANQITASATNLKTLVELSMPPALARELIFQINGGFGANLVTNGTFNTDILGWANTSTPPALIQWSAGRMNMQRTTGTARADQQVSGLEVGKKYQIDFDVTGVMATVYVGSGAAGTNDLVNGSGQNAHVTYQFVTPVNSVALRFLQFTTGDAFLDSVSIRQVIL